jgi:hypothetical protein
MNLILILFSLWIGHSHAFEARLAIDPSINLKELAQTGEVRVKIVKSSGVFFSDASAVIRVDMVKLIDASVDYDRYTEMGMPNLRESHIIEKARDGFTLFTWSKMSTLGVTSQHYTEVRVLPAFKDGKFACEWELSRRRPGRPGWIYEDSPAFSRLDGSWYLETLPDGSIYARYFLAADIDTVIPDFLVDGVARKNFGEGVRRVIQVLARQASVRH